MVELAGDARVDHGHGVRRRAGDGVTRACATNWGAVHLTRDRLSGAASATRAWVHSLAIFPSPTT